MSEPTCSICGLPVARGQNFCPSCGAPTPADLRWSAGADADGVDSGPTVAPFDVEASRARLQAAVGGDFEVGALVGRGGFAEVFEARDVRLRRRVAIKALRPDLGVSGNLPDRFQREARAIAGLRHPHVMEIYSVGEGDGVAYFVMPFVDGESLRERMERDGPLPLPDACRILKDAAAALGAAHGAGLIHRDVKPDNILLEGPEGRVLLADFGIAKAVAGGDDGTTGTGVFVGTPQYMSPEQAAGDPLDPRTDVYSLGVVAYQMIVGRLPFQGDGAQVLMAKHLTEEPTPLGLLRTDCPAGVENLVMRCLAKDPGVRPSSGSDVAEALAAGGDEPAAAVGRPAPESALPRPEAVPPRVSRFRRGALVAVGGGVAAPLLEWSLRSSVGVTVAVPVVAALWLASAYGRLWTAGYGWGHIVRGEEPPAPPRARETEEFGRHGSLVRECTGDRAHILAAFGEIPHAEQVLFPELQETLDHLLARIKHVARNVASLEARIAEVGLDLERRRAGYGGASDPGLEQSAVRRASAQLQELVSARDEAGRELRLCVTMLRDVRYSFAHEGQLDEMAARRALSRALSAAVEHLAAGAG